MQLRDVVDQLHDHDGLADPSAAKRADLATLQERTDEVDYLDAGSQDLRIGGLVHQGGSRAVDRAVLLSNDRPSLVHRIAADVKHAPHNARADGHGNGLAGIDHLHAALEAVSGGHGNRPNPVVAKVLLNFEGQFSLPQQRDIVFDGQGVVDEGELIGKLDVHHWADDLNDFAFIHGIRFVRKSSVGWALSRGPWQRWRFPAVPW